MNYRNKRRVVFIVIIIVTILVPAVFWVYQVMYGYFRDIDVIKDSYVYEYYPSNNFGRDNYLRVGNCQYGKTEAYYHFDVSSLPKGWTEAKLVVYFEYGSNFVDVGVNLTYESWDELTITWNNKPINIIYGGHILNDGFNFHVPLKPENFTNDEVTICLYGKGGDSDGFIEGPSREGASNDREVPFIRLTYEGLDPNVLLSIIVGSVVFCFVIALFVYLELKKPKKRIEFQLPDVASYSRKIKRNRLIENKINEYITLRMEHGKTYIYVKGKRFIQCIRLILNIPNEDVTIYEEIESIDEAAKIYRENLFQNRFVRGPMAAPLRNQMHNVTSEQEFWGHCSNIQAWVEHDYDTRVLMSNISFPLLRVLSEAGDPLAKKVFKEEIALRLESGYPSVVQYLINQGYIKHFTRSEFKNILESTNLIKNLSSKPMMLIRFLNSCISRFPTNLGDILTEILKLPKSKAIFISFARASSRHNPRLLPSIKKVLEDLLLQSDENMHVNIIACINALENNFEASPFNVTANSVRSRFISRRIQLENLDDAAFDDLGLKEKLRAMNEIFGKTRKNLSKCRYCGKMIRAGQDTCDWCGHQRDDDEDYFPYPYIFKPPGGGGGMHKEGALVIPVKEKSIVVRVK